MKLKRILKSSVSVFLAVLMMCSTLMLGTVSTNAATIPAGTTIYFDASNATSAFSSVYCSVVSSSNQNYTANSSDTSGANSYVPKNDTWYTMSKISGTNIYSCTITSASTIGKLSFWSVNESTYDNVWQTNCSLGATYNGTDNMFTIGSTATNNSGRNSYCYSGTWSTYEPTPVAMVCPPNVLNGTDVMFYVKAYANGAGAIGLSNGTAGESNSIRSTELDHSSGYGYMQIAKSNLSSYTYITNNIPSWNGVQNADIANAKGGELFRGDGTVSTTAAVSATTSLSETATTLGSTTPLTLTNTASSTTSVYNNLNMYVMYYLDGELLNSDDTRATTSASTYDVDVSALSEGTHTIQTVLTDKNIFYIADTDTFEVADVATHSVSFTSSVTGGTVKVNGSTTSPVKVAEDGTYTVTFEPEAGYQLESFTVNGTTATVSNNSYTGTMGSADVTLVATFSKVPYNVNVASATGGSAAVSPSSAGVGDTVTVTPVAATGYTIAGVTVTQSGGSSVTVTDNGDGTFGFTMPAAEVTVTPSFTKTQYAINASGTYGTVSAYVNDSATASTTFTYGDKIVFGLTPDEGFELTKLTYNGADVTADVISNEYTVAAAPDSDITISAEFAAKTYNLSYASVTGGSVTGNATATFEDSVTVTVTTDTGYTCTKVDVIGTTTVTATDNGDGTFTFAMPASDVTVTPIFNAKDVTAPAVSINGGTGGSTTIDGVNRALLLTPVTSVTDDYSEVDTASCGFTSITKDGAAVSDMSAYLTEDVTGSNFSAAEPGVYVVTYTGVAKSTVDSSKTATNTATITITVSYTATQQAYVDLKANITACTVNGSDYDTTSQYWADYAAAMNDATALAGDGTTLPAYTAENVSEFTSANTALLTAYANLANCKNQTTIYVLSMYSTDLAIHAWNKTTDCSLSDGRNDMTLEASYVISGTTRYLWSISYTGTSNFIIFRGTGGVENGKKITGDITTCSTANTSYYFDLRAISVGNAATTTYTSTPYVSVLVSSIVDQTPTVAILPGDTVNLTTKYPASITGGTLSDYSTLSYYVDGIKVADPTAWTATEGDHIVYVTAEGGIKTGTTSTPYETSISNSLTLSVGGYLVSWTEPDLSQGTITVTSNGTAISNGSYVPAGATVVFTATPATGYTIADPAWTTTVGTVSTTTVTNDTLTVLNVADDITGVSVAFEKETYTIDYATVSNGTVTGVTSAEYGDLITVTATADNGFTCTKVDAIGTTTVTATDKGDGTFTFAMPASDVTVTPIFNAKDVTAPAVSINGGTGGSTTIDGVNRALLLTPVTTVNDDFAEVDNANCGFTSITKDGTEVADISAYLTEDVTGSNFSAAEPGTYVVTYTGEVKSTVDSSKTATNTATITITVSYSPVQQAYADLQSAVEGKTPVDPEDYTSGADEYNTALAAAQAALTGMPAWDATDVYSDLLDAYNTAEENLVEASVYFYVALDSSWGANLYPMAFSTNTDVASYYAYADGISNSSSKGFNILNGSQTLYSTSSSSTSVVNGKTFKVSAFKAPVGSTVYVGTYNTDGTYLTDFGLKSFTVENGAMYALYSTGIDSNHSTSLAPAEMTSVTVSGTDDDRFSGETFNLSSAYNAYYNGKNSASNAATSGGDQFDIKYTIIDPTGRTVDLASNSWTPALSGVYTVKASMVDRTTGLIKNSISTQVTINDAYTIGINSTTGGTAAAYVNNIEVTGSAAGKTVTVKAVTTEGYNYLSDVTAVTELGEEIKVVNNGNDTFSFTMPESNVVVTPIFAEQPTYTVTLNCDSAFGSVLATAEGSTFSTSASVHRGSVVEITATPSTGYIFEKWTSEQTLTYADGYSQNSNPTRIVVTDTTAITADFFEKSFFLADLCKGQSAPTTTYSTDTILGMKSEQFVKEGTDSSTGIETYRSMGVVESGRVFTVHDTSKILTSGTNFWMYPEENVMANYAGDDATTWTSSANAMYYYNADAANYSSNVYIEYDPANDNITKMYLKRAETFTVAIKQGAQSSALNNIQMGDSYLDDIVDKTTTAHTYDDLNVSFTTQTPLVNNAELDYNGYMYKVYGYSILMTMKDGTTQIESLLEDKIRELRDGRYGGTYVFPSNVQSAVVTPVFTVSDDYAAAKGITWTTLYVKVAPGSDFFNGSYEPRYFTWRSTGSEAEIVQVTRKDGSTLNMENHPDGAWRYADVGNEGGQIMLYVANNMYMTTVQSDIAGILFDETNTNQTFDYNEFIKLQNLGYDNITFEPKPEKAETLAASLNGSYSSQGNKVYDSSAPVGLTDSITNDEFELDVNIENDYIDVFGNVLLDTNGDTINRVDLLAANPSITTTKAELDKVLELMGRSTSSASLYGARWGDYKQDVGYNMSYATRVYYFDGVTKQMVSQQISGYGTIEGASSVDDHSKTNAETGLVDWNYYLGSNNGTTGTFVTGYELIPETYVGVPYLVSYKNRITKIGEGTRFDGKWYYMARTPQVTATAKVGLLDENGDLVMSNGTITEQGPDVGSAYVQGLESVEVDQGSYVYYTNTPGSGYKFIGWYQPNGAYVNAVPSFETMAASDSTLFAVFQKMTSGTLTVTNNVYRGNNPANGGGYGIAQVAVIVTHADGTTETITKDNSVSVSIQDGDKLKYVLYGRASGADSFINFRTLGVDSESGENYYYGLGGEISPDGVTHTFTSQEIIWNWYDQTQTFDQSKWYKTFDFFTDFRRVSVYATLNFQYVDRFGKTKTYTVKNIPLSYEEINNNYEPSDETILAYAPPIDEVFKTCTWTCADSSLVSKDKSVATIIGVQEYKKFSTYIDNGIDAPYLYGGEPLPYDTAFYLDAESKDADGNKFLYWEQYSVDKYGAIDESTRTIFSYKEYVGVRVSFDRYFKAVYGEAEVDPFTTNLQDPIYTREKYTDTATGETKDYIYSDFLLQFETSYNGMRFSDVVKNGAEGISNVKFGFILESDTAYEGYNGSDNFQAPITDKASVVDTVLALGGNIATGGTTSGWNETATTSMPQYDYYYYLYDLGNNVDSLTSLGRLDYYLKMDNTAANRSKVFNVYSYIIYTDTTTNEQKVVLSTPKVMNIYDIGITDVAQ